MIPDLSVRALRNKSKNRFMTNGHNEASLGTLVRRITVKALSAGRIVRSLGAATHSSGNRPYYLWEGMKNKLFHPAFYFGLFLTLMWISVFLEMDWSRIAAHYIGYFVFMALLGTMVSFTYVNVYYVPFKNGIIRSSTRESRTAGNEPAGRHPCF